MARTPENEAATRGKMTASRVAPLMTGDRDKIMRLYRVLIGEEQEEDLSDVWSVQLGLTTEKLNLDRYEKKNSCILTMRGKVVADKNISWAACTLDGYHVELKCPVEAKHCGGREPFELIVDRYQPQLQWQMMVTGSKQCAISVILGADEPRVDYIERAPEYIDEMVKRATKFMYCVDLRMLPFADEPVPPPVDATKTIDMSGNNRWAAYAADFLAHYDSSKIVDNAKELLKSLVPPDAKKCFGHGVVVSRSKGGSLSLRKSRDD